MNFLKRIFTITVCFSMIFILACETDQGIKPQNGSKTGYAQEQSFPAVGNEVVGIKDEAGKFTGYYFRDNPSEIISIAESAEVSIQPRSTSIVSFLGDMDNFGFGGEDPPPCIFYDFSEAIDDLGLFDRELVSGDETESWTHDFTADENYCDNLLASSVTVEVREYFSDFTASTINIDGNVLNFTSGGFSLCSGAIVQTFTFSGAAAAFANDGVVNITFSENGDNIAIDWVRVTVEGECNIIIDGCDSGVENQTIGETTMMALILECADNASNHGEFVSCVSALINAWKKAGLITGEQKGAIMACAAGANWP